MMAMFPEGDSFKCYSKQSSEIIIRVSMYCVLMNEGMKSVHYIYR